MTQSPLCPGWVHRREHQPEGGTPLELLARTARLPGNSRLTLSAELLAEVQEISSTPAASDEIEEDVVVGAVESAGLPCKRREPGWVVPVGAGRSVEVALVRVAGRLRVESVLMSWDEIGDIEQEALARFLCRAQSGLRFARCELHPKQVVVAANLTSADLESSLPHAVAAVVAAGRVLVHEVAALMSRELAQEYVNFFDR
jgi:hypothetical protein